MQDILLPQGFLAVLALCRGGRKQALSCIRWAFIVRFVLGRVYLNGGIPGVSVPWGCRAF